MGKLDGKVAIVTGASTGIGRAITKRFIAEGASVIALARDEKKLAALAAENPGKIITQSCDVAVPEQVDAAIALCRQTFGKLDILINNAGISGPAGMLLHEIAIKDWDGVFDVNVRGVYLMLRGAIPMLLERGGAVVNIASTGGLVATPGNAGYFASKGAVVQVTRAAAMDYVQNNIRVNAICPGVIETPILGGAPSSMIESIVSRIPMRRMGQPDEIAALTLFLASDEASFITGSIYTADGGQTAGAA
ncbi:MAG: SDR family NAD(P)-dependent oxidoreductase [Spongiibacteraceae bacterium]